MAAVTACSASPETGRAGTTADPSVTAGTGDTGPPRASADRPTLSAAPDASPPSLTPAEQRELDERLVDAAWDADVDRARRLIARGADVDWRDDTQQSAFLIATSEGPLELLELTLDSGADVGLHDGFDGTGLIRAAERGLGQVVGRLLQTDIEVDHVNNLGWVALHEAIILGDGSRGYVDTVRALVAGGADLEVTPVRDGIAPVEHARSRGQDAVVATLSRALADPAPRDPDRALLAAAAAGDADRAAVALRAGADLEARDSRERTPLLLAVTEERLAVARLLVALGASPDAFDDRHDTPWLVTGVTGSVPMAEVLLAHDPDLGIRNRFGGTSIIPASERGHVDYVRRVARTGIDLDHVNDLGWTALLEAVILGDGSRPYQRIVRILLAAGADPGIADRDGVTALEHAISGGQTRVARLLARAG
ncbi:ankyrin repeat domain-containing protein [Nocardioides sp. MJB4]|uniref:Ankyrin repeat domain-containing protein n=1 Tax=Nocardioides donggukensis TaxID=2774019 RepID=A0A927K676_9ACTN|nr:ankyrin repeat domain-containing protein [Nocardioides donggukensis]